MRFYGWESLRRSVKAKVTISGKHKELIISNGKNFALSSSSRIVLCTLCRIDVCRELNDVFRRVSWAFRTDIILD